tara:strand:+ start:1249 stop:4539 length:3291 start_codon:yes stop_codon:yes gene_type:complete
MNEIQILSEYVSKPRGNKKINGVMTPVYLKPYDKKFNYTKQFIKFNNLILKQGLTNTIVYDDKLIFNRVNNTFENKSKYFKKKKLKKGQKQYLQFIDNIVQINPVSLQLNELGQLYTYRNNFAQQPGQPYHTSIFRLKQILNTYRGQRILIKAKLGIINWEKEFTFDVPVNDFKKWFNSEAPWLQFEVNSGEYIFDYEQNHEVGTFLGGTPYDAKDQMRMRIFIINNVAPQTYAQAFADSTVNHCVLKPVRDYLEFRIDNVKNKETSTIKKYTGAMNKLVRWETEYPVGKGIPIKLLQQFCTETGFGIDLYLPDNKPEGRKWLTYRPPKEPTKIFKFINTRHNHLDITAQLDNNYRETINQEQYDIILTDLWKSNKYYVYNEYSIITQQKIYQIESEFNSIVNDFEKNNELKRFRLNDLNPKQETLIQFIKASCVYNGCVDFEPTFMYRELDIHNVKDFNKLEEEYGKSIYSVFDAENVAEKLYKKYKKNLNESDIKQIDMSKAYTRCCDSPEFCGYPAKITDMRKTDRIMGVGFYLVEEFSDIPDFIEKLGVYFNNNIYTSPELKYIKKLGANFKIIAGCWGTTCNINWGLEKDETGEYTGMYKKSDNKSGCRNYVKWFGCSIKTTGHTTYKYMTDNKKYIENWAYENIHCGEEGVNIKYTQGLRDGGEAFKDYYNVLMNIPKQNIYHHSHIASFIYGYQRIMMMEQLSKIPIDKIVRVCVDGIYYHDCEFEIMKNFNIDKELKFGNTAGYNYRTKNYEWYDLSEFGENKDFNKREVWTGPGGCGKTYQNILDKGNCDVVYIAHSWKLSSAKRDEFKGLDVSVVQRLTMDDWFVDGQVKNYWEPIANKYSTLIIDEISTLSNNMKNIIEKRFPYHKIIYCGDIGKYRGKTIMYQCPPIFNIQGDTCFKIEQNYKHYHLEGNRRCECKKLEKLLLTLRKIIENGSMKNYGEITKWIERTFKIIDKNNIDYNPCDMILSRSHKVNDFYDDKFKDIEKYYITQKHFFAENTSGKINGVDIYNGQIFIEKPDVPDSKMIWKNKKLKKTYKYRHGYTIDCIQGETAIHKLIIDINDLNSWQHLYTAISRAKYYKQIVVVK